MAWVSLVLAGILEIVWAYFMKQSNGFTKAVPTIVTVGTMIASFSLLAYSMKTLPLGIAYTMWTGIGAVGSMLVGMAILGEQMTFLRIVSTLLIISGLLLMKLSSSSH